jgi:hypothetical protein
MVQIAPGWELDVERRREWLLLRVRRTGQDAVHDPPLAEEAWRLLQQHRLGQLVVELDQLEVLTSFLIGQLILLQKRICAGSGALRWCGLSPLNLQAIRLCCLEGRLPHFRDREEAIAR